MANYERVNWDNGTKVKEGYTIINGQEYQTVQPEYTGNTPVNPENLNHMDEQIEALSVDFVVEEGVGYIKYNSGKMMQWGAIEVTEKVTTAMGSVYRTANEQIKTLPVPFVDNIYYIITTAHAGLNSFYISSKSPDKFGGFAIGYNSVTTTASRYVYWMAIGKWK